MHDEEAGRLSVATNEDNIEHERDEVLFDRRVIIDRVENYLQISHGSAFKVIQNGLGSH
jgi:hypothetical protein